MRGKAGIGRWICVIGLSVMAGTGAAEAQRSEPVTDKEGQRQCDRDLCAIVNAPASAGADLSCDLAETWYKEEITAAIKKGRISWPFGDARCYGTVGVGRALLAPAITEAKYTLKSPPLPVRCEVDTDSGRHEVKANMAPVIEFKGGKATSVSLGLQDIEGTPLVSNVVWAAWKLESTFGFFHEDFVKGVNAYIAEHCPTMK
jgi:hypothetical protein